MPPGLQHENLSDASGRGIAEIALRVKAGALTLP